MVLSLGYFFICYTLINCTKYFHGASKVRYKSFIIFIFFISIALVSNISIAADKQLPKITGATAAEIIQNAIRQFRGQTSYSESTMVVHRPDWERTTSIVSWTSGDKDALIRFTAPAKDAGSGTLKKGEQMWTFTPKKNRVIRLPFSMMAQSWGGSDFSYNDLSKTDKLIQHYEHKLVEIKEIEGHKVFVIESTPKEDAPVVWGKEVLTVRDDYVLIEHAFYDQDLKLLKKMETLEIKEMGGRMLATHIRMIPLEKEDNWTDLVYQKAEFDIEIPKNKISLFSLRNPGD